MDELTVMSTRTCLTHLNMEKMHSTLIVHTITAEHTQHLSFQLGSLLSITKLWDHCDWVFGSTFKLGSLKNNKTDFIQGLVTRTPGLLLLNFLTRLMQQIFLKNEVHSFYPKAIQL